MGFVLYLLLPVLAKDILGVGVLVVLGVAIYSLLIYAVTGQGFIEDIERVIYELKKR